jgi:hypothetical protein
MPQSYHTARSSGKIAFYVRCLGLAAALHFDAGTAASAQNYQSGCNIYVYGSVHGDAIIYCYKPGEPQNSKRLSAEQIRSNLYSAVMEYIGGETITRGKSEFRNRLFRDVYPHAQSPKAVAACIDWRNSTPSRLNLTGKGKFQFITGNGDCRPSDSRHAVSCAVAECRAYSGCGGGEVCTVVDADGRNELRPPEAWMQRIIQQQ